MAADAYARLNQPLRLELALKRLSELTPEVPEPWYDLASTQAILGKQADALVSFGKAMELSAARLAADPSAPDLRANARTNPALASLRDHPEFKRWIESP